MKIDYIAQINTGTISTAIRSAKDELFGTMAFDPKKEKLISEMIYIIIRTRRNRNNHFCFPNQGEDRYGGSGDDLSSSAQYA